MLEWVAAISALSSCAVSITYAIIAYKKSKKPPKDEVWEAALRITACHSSGMCDADQFAQTYEELKAFKDNGCSMGGHNTLRALVRSASPKVYDQSPTQPKTPEQLY